VPAADVGVASLLWLVDEANRRVRRLADRLGGRFTLQHGVLEGTTSLPQVADLDAAQIVRCARAARRRAAEPAAARARRGAVRCSSEIAVAATSDRPLSADR
jgi:hypothetical protein